MNQIDIVIFLVPSVFSFIFICDALLHIFRLGKSKNHLKKIRKSYTFGQRIAMKHISVENCKYHKSTVKRFLLLRKVYIIVFLFFLFLGLLTLVFHRLYIVWYWGIRGKGVLLDAPVILYSFIMTKNDMKHGGVTWRYTKDE